MSEDEYLTTEQVAAIVHARPETVRYWRYMGTGPDSFKVGRRVLYAKESVDHWLQAAREQAKGSAA